MSDEFNGRVRAFIVENFLFGDTSVALADDASLIENDIVDSTAFTSSRVVTHRHADQRQCPAQRFRAAAVACCCRVA